MNKFKKYFLEILWTIKGLAIIQQKKKKKDLQ